MSNETKIVNTLQTIPVESLNTQITTIIKDGEPLFVGKEIAAALGYERPADAVRQHVLPIDRITITKAELRQMLSNQLENQEVHNSPKFDLTPFKGISKITLINESGLYTLIFRSNMPKAREATHEVTSKILPSIRKYGEYKTEAKKMVDMERHIESIRATFEIAYQRGARAAFQAIEEQMEAREYKSFLKGYREGVKDITKK